MSVLAKIFSRCRKGAVLLAVCLLAMSMPASARNNKKSSSKSGTAFDFDKYMPESKLVDQTIGQMLGYWQIGDVNSLRKYYANDVVVVSGNWGPPVIGWDKYAKAYEEQRARVSGVRLDRSNTYIKVNGNFAWATYQWVYRATLGGQPAVYRGHTSLVLNKQGNQWVIVLDHSSIVPGPNSAKPAPSAAPAPSGQPQNDFRPK